MDWCEKESSNLIFFQTCNTFVEVMLEFILRKHDSLWIRHSSSCMLKKIWKILMLLTWTFQQGQSSILISVFVLIIEDYGMKPKNCGTRKKKFSYFTVISTVRIRLQEKGPYSIITHIDDLKELFPDENFSMFWLDYYYYYYYYHKIGFHITQWFFSL